MPTVAEMGAVRGSVVDASLVVAALVDTGEEGIWAESILAAGPLYAPELLGVEVFNALRRLELKGVLTPAQADAARTDAQRLPVELFPFQPVAERVWQLRAQLTSYDAWYVSLAEALHLPLATLDLRLARSRGIECKVRLPAAAS